ncbi:MAG: hypothetical protein QNJ54_26085 [Prochloraceae cyanobacterium]|nr:hypothetical protein [Prochloraceae cyanobacterium]
MSFPELSPQTYEITIKGHLPQDWEDWFDGMKIQTHPQRNETILKGSVVDQAELFGLLIKIRDLGLILIEVRNLNKISK